MWLILNIIIIIHRRHHHHHIYTYSTLQSHNITQAKGMNKRVGFFFVVVVFIVHERMKKKVIFLYEHMNWTQWTPISFFKGLVLMGFVWCVIKNGF